MRGRIQIVFNAISGLCNLLEMEVERFSTFNFSKLGKVAFSLIENENKSEYNFSVIKKTNGGKSLRTIGFV